MSNQSAAAAAATARRASRLATDAETAEYIGDMLGQLAVLAATHGLVDLIYQLRVAREEASRIATA